MCWPQPRGPGRVSYSGEVLIRHLNCATLCPPAARLTVGGPHLVCHCLLLETRRHGLVLIDTGIGLLDIHDRRRLPALRRRLLRPRLAATETAAAQTEALGYQRTDVRHIVLTHLHLAHAGGIADFPWAAVHVHAAELYAATRHPRRARRAGYVAEQWAHAPLWQSYTDAGDDWLGLRAVRRLRTLDEDILLVPLVGHSQGHTAVAVRAGERWLLHAGDAYLHRAALSDAKGPRVLSWVERAEAFSRSARNENLARLRELQRDHQVTVFCSHDPAEFDGLRSGYFR
jgi:glyoxylase-like metal-dependent hydrolase (beta-lactamase superfamily II)